MEINFDNIKSYLSLLLEPSIILFIGILTVYVTKNSNKHNVMRDRLTNAYHPLFLAIEPYLYKPYNHENALYFISRFQIINKDYSLLIYPSLRFRVECLNESINSKATKDVMNEHWKIICRYIDYEYDKLCKKSHMPLRSSTYRFNKKQYSTKSSLYFALFKLFVFPPIIYILLVVILYLSPVFK